MLSVRTSKALISDVPWIVLIDVNACHANVMNYFYDVSYDQCALGYLRNNIFYVKNVFLETLNWRNSPIAKISLIAKLLQ